MGRGMDPSRKRAIRLTVALTVALLLASALVYTSFASGRDEVTASQLVKKARPGKTYILAGTVLSGSVQRDGGVLRAPLRIAEAIRQTSREKYQPLLVYSACEYRPRDKGVKAMGAQRSIADSASTPGA